MKKILLSLLLTTICISLIYADGWRKDEKQVKVEFEAQTAEKLAKLRLNGDYYLDHAIIYAIPSELYKLEKAGISYSVIIDNLNEYYRDFWETKAQYHSYQEIVDLADSLAQNFPNSCMKILYGESI